jgi:transketolase C-terminal domain/subunit
MLEHSMKAAEILKTNGVDCAIINLFRLKPLDLKGITEIASEYGQVFCIEDVIHEGSISQKISSHLQQNNQKIRFVQMTLPESFDQSGKVDEILESIGMDAAGIARTIEINMKHN